MEYRDDRGITHTESFDDIDTLMKRRAEIKAKGYEITRLYYVDDNKVTPHQGKREVERRLEQLLKAQTKGGA